MKSIASEVVQKFPKPFSAVALMRRNMAAIEMFDRLPDTAHVRLPVVVALDASSAASVWRKVKKQTLPAPVKLGPRITAWNVGVLRQHFASMVAGGQK